MIKSCRFAILEAVSIACWQISLDSTPKAILDDIELSDKKICCGT